VWNIPSERCDQQYDVMINRALQKLGVDVNALGEGGWQGSIITLIYREELGFYPWIAQNGTLVNGGLPQMGNLSEHLRKMESDLNVMIPDVRYDGLGVIDWEAWRPLWDRNYDSFDRYRQLSVKKVSEEHPDWSRDEVERAAKDEFEAAAREFMQQTMLRAEELRPHAKWGFYLFPNCHNTKSQRHCTHKEQRLNNKLLWLFNASSSLYPSAYLVSGANHTSNQDHIHGQIGEALRIQNKLEKPVYMYHRIRYGGNNHYYNAHDLHYAITESYSRGFEGVVLWDDHNVSLSADTCHRLLSFITQTLGPIIANLTSQ
ncbi:hypothetical protein CAPTEDRAFT_100896, partial [Capitella teleta]